MTKKKLMTMATVLIAFTMTVAPAVTAFAEGEDAKETVFEGTFNSVTIDDGHAAIMAFEGGEVTVTGDVKSTYENIVVNPHPVIMNTGTVTVEGDVVATGTICIPNGIGNDNGKVTIGGIVDAQTAGEGIFSVGEKAEVNVNNMNDDEVAVFGGQFGIVSMDGATVNVDGSVVATGIRENENESSAAVHAGDTANVTILGDITSPEKGIELELTGAEKKGYVFIDGTVSGGTGSISLQDGGFEKTPQLGELSEALPSITLWFLEGDHKLMMDETFLKGLSNEEQGKLFSEVYESINYIIREDPDSEVVSMYKLSTEEGFSDGVKTVRMGQPLTIKAIDGYEITSVEAGAGSNHVKKNDDGTYTLITEYGGIALAVKVKKIVNEETGEVTYEVVGQTQETTTAPTPEQTITPVVSTGGSATASVGGTPIAAISGEKVAKTVAFSVSNVTPVQYKNAIIENVTSAPANGAFNIVTDQVACFDTKMIEAFASRPDVDVNVVFTYNGRKIKVVIPAGYDVRSLLDANGYCGYLRLLSLLGGTDL